jgi:hypothetical protein
MTILQRGASFDWAIKLAIEKICDRLPPDTIEQVNQVVAAGLGIKKQLDRIEYVQIEILKMLQASNENSARKIERSDCAANSNGASPVTADIGPDPAT